MTTETPKTEAELTKCRLVCIGKRLNGNSAVPLQVWRVLENDELGEILSFNIKGKMRGLADASPGQMFECYKDERGSWICAGPNAPKYIGLYYDTSAVAMWRLSHDTARATLDMRNQMLRDRTKNHLAELLAPIREQYKKAHFVDERHALLATVIEIITR